MKKKFLSIGICSILLLLGAGCGSKNNATNVQNTNNEEQVETTLQQDAYLFCVQKNYEIQIRFESAQNKNIAYCVFGEGKECESIAFMKGSCSDKAKTATSTEDDISRMFEPTEQDEFPLRLCDSIARPVCGVDNRTYTNACVAQFLGINVEHEGSCARSANEPPQETPINDTPVVDISNPKNSKKTQSSSVSSPLRKDTEIAATNTWTEIPLSVLESTSGSNSIIKRCTTNAQVNFLVTTEGQDPFSTLYTQKGEVLCYPEHDINASCPSYVTSGAYKTSCQKVSGG